METVFAYAPRCESLDHVPVDELMQMRESGMTNKQIADHFGVSDTKIGQILPAKYKRLTDEDRQGVVRAWNQNKTKTEIAIMFGVSEATIVDTLRNAGVYIPLLKRHWTTKEIDRLERCVNRGMSFGDIAIELGRSIESVRFGVKRYLRKPAERRIDGTPVSPKTATGKPSLTGPEQIPLDSGSSPSLSVEEKHTKTIFGEFGEYVYEVDKDALKFVLDPAIAENLITTKARLAAYIRELTAVWEEIA